MCILCTSSFVLADSVKPYSELPNLEKNPLFGTRPWEEQLYNDKDKYKEEVSVNCEKKQKELILLEEKRREEERRKKEEEKRRLAEEQAQIDNSDSNTSSVYESVDTDDTDDSEYNYSEGSEVVDYARKYLGNPYVLGGESLTKGCDCSGFTKSIYKKFGISLPHDAVAQRNKGKLISKTKLKEARPGDLLIYDGCAHVAIFTGVKNGKYMQIHASEPKTGIIESPVSWSLKSHKHFLGIYRVLKETAGEIAVNAAKAHIGSITYSRSPKKTWKKTDCGGMIKLAYREAGIKIPHNTKYLKNFGKSIGTDYSKAKPGDIIVQPLSGYPEYRHVALYAGNGKKIEVVQKGGDRIRMVKVNKKATLDIRRVK